jgi:proteasome accessory factor B
LAKPDNDTTKAIRIAMVFDILNNKSPYGGVTLEDLAAACEVSTRSILRYLDHIENDMRRPLIRPDKNAAKGLYRLRTGYLPSISPEKALIIFLSLLQQRGSALTGQTDEIKDKLVGTLFKNKYPFESIPIEKLQERIYVVEEGLADPAKVGQLFTKLVDC